MAIMEDESMLSRLYDCHTVPWMKICGLGAKKTLGFGPRACRTTHRKVDPDSVGNVVD